MQPTQRDLDEFKENEFAKNEKYIICNKGTIKC